MDGEAIKLYRLSTDDKRGSNRWAIVQEEDGKKIKIYYADSLLSSREIVRRLILSSPKTPESLRIALSKAITPGLVRDVLHEFTKINFSEKCFTVSVSR